MIFRLEYKNRNGLQARLDISTPGSSVVKEIEGTEQPFLLSYKGDKNDKSLNFLTSSAEINIYETPEFNIDKLKTSNETQIKVDYYIDSVKYWEGFVIPDFFQREIGGAGVVSMVASDRLSTLKGVTLSDLPSMISIRELAVQCLAKTGLDLPLKTMADFQHGSTVNGFFTSEVSSQRLYDTRGRSISCYDILKSILVASYSRLEQAGGEWRITNKLQHELGTGRLYSDTNTFTNYSENVFNFDEVTKGAMRTIVPVAGSVGIYHEHGGGNIHPENFDFSRGMEGWTAVGGFDCSIEDREILGFTSGYPMWGVEYGDQERNRLMIRQSYRTVWAYPDSLPHVKASFPVITTNENSVNIEIDISVLGSGSNVAGSTGRFLVLAEKGSDRMAFNPTTGAFEVFDQEKWRGSESAYFIRLTPNWEKEEEAATRSAKFTAPLEVDGDLSDYTVTIRAYGVSGITGAYTPIFVNKAGVRFSNTQDVPKGVIYKTDQGGEFTKTHDIETTIFGDYLTKGLDGYFYDYPIDDTSSLYQDGELTSLWATPFVAGESGVYNLLRHSVIQHRRMFSVAHDLISGEIDLSTFNPLTIFKDCNDKRYVVVSAEFDFLRSNVKVELEEIAYANLTVRDFIYSYFGEGESGISSVGGISTGTGGGGSGGGMTPDQIAILSELQTLAHDHPNKEIIDQLTQVMIDNASREMVTSDSETTLSDNNYLSSLRAIKEITERALSKVNEDEAKEVITFLKGVIAKGTSHFVDLIASGKITSVDIEALNKITTKDLDASDTITAKDIISDSILTDILYSIVRAELQDVTLKGQLNSEAFTSGFLGNGFRLNKIGEDWILELDKIIVRKAMDVYELIIQRVRYQGGQVIHSPAGGKITKVEDKGDYWRVEHDSPDSFTVGAQVLCQNIKVGSQAQNPTGATTVNGISVKRYWRLVTHSGKGWFWLSKTDMEVGSSIPEVDDEIAVLGHRTDPNQQSAIMIVATGSNSPYTAYYSGINSYSLEGKEFPRLGNLEGIHDPDFGQLHGFGLYAQNVFLKGVFRLRSGRTVEEELESRGDVGGVNLLREFDIRFGFKYWGESGETAEEEIVIDTQYYVGDDYNALVDENGNIFKYQ